MGIFESMWFQVGVPVLALVFVAIMLAALYRVVVQTNDVHVVQSAKTTQSFGKGQPGGNVYYAWPSWWPMIGVKVIQLPMSVFDVALDNYPGYDKGRVPFVVDVMAFFRVTDSNLAAQRVFSHAELIDQLKSILQGSVRAILAQSEIEEILEGRGRFGDMFTKEVDDNLAAWGVSTVKCIELMDIRDGEASKVVANIMAKKQSLIEKQSRVEVAANRRDAQNAEIEAKRDVDLRAQEALQTVGERTAAQERNVGIAKQKSEQDIQSETKVTTQRKMEVLQVENVRSAEIVREVQVVEADRDRQKMVIAADADKQKRVIEAEGQKAQTVTIAQGDLEQAQLHAKGVEAEGIAEGIAKQAVLMAPVNSQITLAKEIGQNAGYQTYLVSIRNIEAAQAVGIAQSEALKAAQIKVIATTGSDVADGVTKAMEVLSAKGGVKVGAMLEGLAQTDLGAAVLKRAGIGPNGEAEVQHHPV